MNQEPAQILKVDVTGRVWTPLGRREAVLDEFERSGMPATKFAEHVGVKYSTFASWVQKRRRQRATAETTGTVKIKGREPAGLKWVEAAVQATMTGHARGLMVHLPGGARMEVAEVSQALLAAELVRALASPALAMAEGGRC